MMDLKADLTRCVREGSSRSEILDFVSRDYSIYTLSIRTLDRRLREYQIFYDRENLPVDDVRRAVEIELNGPGKQLRCRPMHKKIRQLYELNVSRSCPGRKMTEKTRFWWKKEDKRSFCLGRDLTGYIHQWLKRYRPRFC